jgi:hypothetical protein
MYVTSGLAYVYNGSSWSSQGSMGITDGATTNFGVPSCVSSSFCLDTMGGEYNGTSWTPPPTVGPNGAFFSYSSVYGVSCASSSFCVAVDNQGDVSIGKP